MNRHLSLRRGLTLALLLASAALPARAQAKKADELHYPPLAPFTIPQPERVVLPNGLVVLLLEDHEFPLVEVTALVRAGGIEDPAAQVGLSQLGAQVLRSGGAGGRGADELDDFLEAKAASIELSSSAGTIRASMDCLKESFPEVLAAFADVLRRPRLPEDRLQLAKANLTASIARQNDNPNGILQRELSKIVYGDTSPWARSATYATVGGISRDDVVAWHQRLFQPQRMVLGLSGDFDRHEVLELVRQAFGDWPKGASAVAPAPPTGKGPKPGVYVVEKDDLNQSYIAMGYLGIRRDNPDYFTLEVMNQMFGGTFTSRLFSTVRSKKGLSYSVFGAVSSAFDHEGMTLILMSTKAETTGAGVTALLDEARGMISQAPDDAEVARAKTAILNAFIFNSDSPSKTLLQQLSYELYGYPRDWLSRYRAGVEAVTTKQVQDAARKYLHADDFAIVIVGPKEGLDRPWTDFGPVTMRDVSIPEPPR